MFSATKFIAAGIVVGLFGGALLIGPLAPRQADEALVGATAPASAAPATPRASARSMPTIAPTAIPERESRTDLLLGTALTVQETEPAVYRVFDDGVRELDGERRFDDKRSQPIAGSVVTGRDGSVWLFRLDGLLRVGEEGLHEWGSRFGPTPRNNDLIRPGSHIKIGPDGRIIARQQGRLISFKGEAEGWRNLQPPLSGEGDGGSVYIAEDGTVWVYDGFDLAWLGLDGWEPSGGSGGSVPATARQQRVDREYLRVLERMPVQLDQEVLDLGDAAVGPRDTNDDGVTWTYRWIESPSIDGAGDLTQLDRTPYLVRMMDEARNDGIEPVFDVFTSDHGVPGQGTCRANECGPSIGLLKTAPDGHVWMTRGDSLGACDGVATFDGASWDSYLDGQCIYSMDIDADGNAWVLAADPAEDGDIVDLGRQYLGGLSPVQLYVVRPRDVG